MVKNNTHKIFGTDGVRGRANYYPMTVEVALALGRAAGQLFRTHEGRHRVVIGKDTRLSCYMFENALISGLCSMGIDTLMVGPLPTPGVAFITRAYRADAGIVISASHNSFRDNGIKFFSSEGIKVSDAFEKQLEDLIAKGNFDDHIPADGDIGRNSKINDADGRYIEFVKNTFPRRSSLLGFKIALDCANGAGYKVAPLIFKELDAEVFVYGNQPNGLNINRDCGSLYPEVVQKAVIEHKADVGITIDGDMILAICAKYMKDKGLLRNNRVVSTVLCNLGFLKAMESLGISVVQSQVGDRYVNQEMTAHSVNLGGEQSGHIIFSDYNTTGDGLVSALQVLNIMRETNCTLSELAKVMKRYPQHSVSVPVGSKPDLEKLKPVQAAIASVEKSLNKRGRVLVRYSGTEPICRVMVEGEDIREVTKLASGIAEVIKMEIGS